MFKIRFAAFAAVILAAIASVASAQQATQAGVGAAAVPDGKIAVINTGAFADGISELKQKYDQVSTQFKARSQKLQDAQTRLASMQNDLQTKQGVMKADEYQKLQDDFDTLKKSTQREYEDAKGEYERQVENSTKPVRDKLYQFMQNYATQHSIVMIINLAGAAQTGTLAYWNPGADITDDFIAEYNKANPVAGAPAAAPKTPATAPATTPARKP